MKYDTKNKAGTPYERAFSLIELSIVLVILGLLTGGILTGQSLIRAAELRSASTQIQNYQSAIYTFRDKYFALPGDITNASAFWGHQHPAASCLNNAGTADNVNGACDGNGNGEINTASTLNRAVEEYQFWRHLGLAGLIEGSYTGLSGSITGVVTGENIPRGKIGSSSWRARPFNAADTAIPADAFAVNMGGTLQLADRESGTGNGLLVPEEAWGIDKKIDDGLPGRGKIIARPWNDNCTLAASRTDLDGAYNLVWDSTACGLLVDAF